MALPRSLKAYFNDLVVGRLQPLSIAVDADLNVTTWEGRPERHGLDRLAVGDPLSDRLPLLVGTLDAIDQPTEFRFVATPNGRFAHVHLLRLPEGGFGVVLVEASRDHEQQQASQQMAHELALANEQKNRLLTALAAAQTELQRRHEQLAEADMLKSLFIGRMSHEFRTPLASVLGHAELAAAGQGDVHTHLAAIRGAGQYLLALVENLLDQARLDNDDLPLQPVPTDLRELTEGLGLMFSQAAHDKGLTFATEMGDLPSTVSIDPTRLRQVLINLLGNAIKFTENGGVRLTVAWQTGHLLADVTDSGPGIPDDMRERVFDAFVQVQDERSRRGAGLGLSISRSLIARMGGTLRLETPPAGGTRFRIDVPAPLYQEAAAQATGAEILVVEDDPDLRALIGIYLESAGFSPRFAEDGEAAVRAVADQPPDLVLMDMHLPKMDGPEATVAIRSQGYAGPIVTLSAAGEASDRAASEAAGSNAYLHKPVDPKLLVSTIRSLTVTAGVS